jgi:hypothetical protein
MAELIACLPKVLEFGDLNPEADQLVYFSLFAVV